MSTPLICEIVANGETVRTIEFDDPRKEFCELFNETHERFGIPLRARLATCEQSDLQEA